MEPEKDTSAMNGLFEEMNGHHPVEQTEENSTELVDIELGHEENGGVEKPKEKHSKKGKKHTKKLNKNGFNKSERHLLSEDDSNHSFGDKPAIEISIPEVIKEPDVTSPKSGKSKDSEEKKMLDMLRAITDSYKTIQTKLDVVGDSVKTSAHFGVHYVQNHSRNFERLVIACLLIPAFVMATLAVYRQENQTYEFDVGETEAQKLYRIAQTNFDSWNEALISQDKERISILYAMELSFLPTMSDQFVVSTRSEDKYFMHFIEKQPAGVIVEDKVQPLGTDAYLHSGLYDFLLMNTADNGVFSTVHARFTFLWRNFDGVWKIMHHHSSQMPSAFKCSTSSNATTTTSTGSGHE